MADVVDEHGNPIQLTDEHGNPVRLSDEHGNPMHLIGVATSPVKKDAINGFGFGSGVSTTGTGAHDGFTTSGATDDAPGSGLPSHHGSTLGSGVSTTSTGTHNMGFGASYATVDTPGYGLPMHYGTGHGSRTHPTGTWSYDTSYGTSHIGGAPGSGLPTNTGQTGYETVPGSGIRDVTAGGIKSGQGMHVGAPTAASQSHYNDSGQLQMERPTEIPRSTSSGSSSEDDGQGGRRKKKGLTQKIKEKFTGKHDEGESQAVSISTTTTTTKMTVAAIAEAPPVGQRHDDVAGHHEKKSFMEKIKEKLPGHHSH